MIEKMQEVCCGCRACEQLCPAGCIHMVADREGFLYPKTDTQHCNQCGLCVQRCPAGRKSQPAALLSAEPPVYACASKDETLLRQSSSGGIFTVFARDLISRNGGVFGCVFGTDFSVHYQLAENEDQLAEMRGSKYVQADTGNSYTQVKNLLAQGRPVLYMGPPCYVAGLYSFLGKTTVPGLLTIDFICHGVPSAWLFRQYLDDLAHSLNGEITAYEFRDKRVFGWCHCESYRYRKSNRSKTRYVAPAPVHYGYYFKNSSINREGCYRCPYGYPSRPADITVGDFWGIEAIHPEFDADDGASVVLLNTPVGRTAFERVAPLMRVIPSQLEAASSYNENLVKPSARPTLRDRFYADVASVGYMAAVNSYNELHFTLRQRLIGRVPWQLRRLVKMARKWLARQKAALSK